MNVSSLVTSGDHWSVVALKRLLLIFCLHCFGGMRLIDLHPVLHIPSNQLKIFLSFSWVISITLYPHYQLQMFPALLTGLLSCLALNWNWEVQLDQWYAFLIAHFLARADEPCIWADTLTVLFIYREMSIELSDLIIQHLPCFLCL